MNRRTFLKAVAALGGLVGLSRRAPALPPPPPPAPTSPAPLTGIPRPMLSVDVPAGVLEWESDRGPRSVAFRGLHAVQPPPPAFPLRDADSRTLHYVIGRPEPVQISVQSLAGAAEDMTDLLRETGDVCRPTALRFCPLGEGPVWTFQRSVLMEVGMLVQGLPAPDWVAQVVNDRHPLYVLTPLTDSTDPTFAAKVREMISSRRRDPMADPGPFEFPADAKIADTPYLGGTVTLTDNVRFIAISLSLPLSGEKVVADRGR